MTRLVPLTRVPVLAPELPWAPAQGDSIPPATIRVQTLDGRWETAGVDRYPGVIPESLRATANDAGPEACSFELRRRPGDVHPDLRGFTDCDIEVGSMLVWSGRVKETPTREGGANTGISVEGQGWQYHGDDDVFERTYLHTRLDDWQDARETTTGLGADQSEAEILVGAEMTLSLPVGASILPGQYLGAILDLKTDDAKYVEIQFAGGGRAGLRLSVSGQDPVSGTQEATILASAPIPTVPTTVVVEFATRRRFVLLYLENQTAAAITGDATSFARILRAHVYYDRAHAGAAPFSPALRATHVVKDARAQGCPLLSSSDERVSETEFILPAYALDAAKTPREVWDAVNALHRWRVQVDAERRLVFQPHPVAPLFEVGEWSGAEFEDASSNSVEEIYNRVVVEGTNIFGLPTRITQTTGDLPLLATEVEQIAAPRPANPTFAVDVSGWTPKMLSAAGGVTADSDGAVARSTDHFDTPPASGRYFRVSAGAFANNQFIEGSFAATAAPDHVFRGGVVYRFLVRVRCANIVGVSVGRQPTDRGHEYAYPAVSGGGFTTVSVGWSPAADVPVASATIRLDPYGVSTVNEMFVDSVSVERVRASLPDRRGFRRTKVIPLSTTIGGGLAEAVGEAFLREHRFTPLRGSLSVVGRGGLRYTLGGSAAHPAELLRSTGRLVRLSHRVDPDSGAWGRDGRIAAVAYDHGEQKASLTIDNSSSRLEALLERMAIVNA